MKRISLFKKIKIFASYKRTLRSVKFELETKYGVRIDNAYRLYTVLNIPSNLIGENYNLNKSDIDKISETYIREFMKEISIFLESKGLRELFTFDKVSKKDKYSYLIVILFSLMDNDKYYKNIYFKVIPTLSIILLSLMTYLIFF